MDTGGLFTFGGPGGEHGGVDGEGRLAEVLVFEGLLSSDATIGVVCQESATTRKKLINILAPCKKKTFTFSVCPSKKA